MKSKLLLIIYPLFLFSQSVFADTHYVATTGADSGDCTNPGSPCLTLNYGISQMAGGDTLEIADGTYSGSGNDLTKNSDIPDGTAGNYTVIRAANIDENTSHVILTSAFDFSVGASESNRMLDYVEFHGLKVVSSVAKNISGRNVKVFKSGFEGGEATDNEITFSVGHHNFAPSSDGILLEDVWSYGSGGRYNIMLYNAQNIVVRRAVIRHDGGWACDGSNPEAGMTIYNSRNIELQNVIVLDSVSDDVGSCQGFNAFYNVSNGSGGTQHENTRIVGSMAVNNSTETGMGWDAGDPIPNALLENSVIFNSGTGIVLNQNGKDVTVTNVTVANSNGDAIADYGTGSTLTISKVLLSNNSGEVLRNASGTDVHCYSNGNTNGCSQTGMNVTNDGFVHLPRIETGSTLETAGTGGTRIGAQIVSRIGVSGTLYGETNYNTEQTALWPWPNEARIAADLCAARSSAMCSAASITDYIWSALGTATPGNLAPMPTPTGVGIIKN